MNDSLKKITPTPKSEINDFERKTFMVSTLRGLDFQRVTINEIPSLESASESDFPKLFIKKCKECSKICDFTSELFDKNAKKLKSDYLIEFEKIFSKIRFTKIINDNLIAEFVKMILANISRSISSLKIISSIECPDNVLDVSWPHLNLVYNAVKSLFSSKLSSKVNDKPLFSSLILNMCSSDQRERQSSNEALTLIFNKLNTELKSYIITNTINKIKLGNSSAELLNFIYDIIPEIKKNNEKNFENTFSTVISLHNSPQYMKFSNNLTQCITRFIRVDNTLLNQAILYIVHHWPTYCIKKQVIFISELEIIMQNFAEDPIIESIAKPLYTKMSELIIDPSVNVAEATFSFLLGQGNEASLIENIEIAIKILVPPLVTCLKQHWNIFIRDDARVVLDLLAKVCPKIYENEIKIMSKEKKEKSAKRKKNWVLVIEKAKGKKK